MAMTKYREGNRAKWIGVRPAHNGIPIVRGGTAQNGISTLYVVTAGKTLYLFNHFGFAQWAAAGAEAFLCVTDAADTVQYYLFYGAFLFALGVSFGISRTVPLEIPSGWKIKIQGSTAQGIISARIEGIEE